MLKQFREIPALGLLLLPWAIPLILVVFSQSIFDEPLGLKTWGIIFGCVGAAALGILTGHRARSEATYDVSARLVGWLGTAGVLMGLLYWTLAGTPETSLEETRKSVHEGVFVQSNAVSYLSQLGVALSLMAVALATQVRKPFLLLGILLAVSTVAWTGVVLNTGGRVFLFAMVAVGVAGMAGRYSRQVFRWRSLAAAVILFVPVFALNVWFVQKRMQTWFDLATLSTSRLDKAETLVGPNAGVVLDSDYATTSIWLLLTFTSDPVYYLDYFVKYVDMPLHRGLYQFSVIANRVPGYDWQAKRDVIDTMYEPLGVKTNVWGTSIRDVMVDFGSIGTVLFFLLMGWASGWLRRAQTPAGRILYVMSLLWLLYSPFHSTLIVRPIQVAVFLAGLWLICEKSLGSRRARAMVADNPSPIKPLPRTTP